MRGWGLLETVPRGRAWGSHAKLISAPRTSSWSSNSPSEPPHLHALASEVTRGTRLQGSRVSTCWDQARVFLARRSSRKTPWLSRTPGRLSGQCSWNALRKASLDFILGGGGAGEEFWSVAFANYWRRISWNRSSNTFVPVAAVFPPPTRPPG